MIPFILSGSAFTAPAYVIATLVQNRNGTYTFTLPDQTADIFSSTGQLLVRTDRNGYQTSLAYNASGQLVSVTDPAGRTLTFTYAGNGLVSSVADPIGRQVTYVYDASSNLTSVTDAGGNITHYTYDGSHRLITMTDPNGGVTSNVYDSSNRVVSQTDPAGRVIKFAYSGATTTVTDGNGNVQNQTYAGNRLTSLTLACGYPGSGHLDLRQRCGGKSHLHYGSERSHLDCDIRYSRKHAQQYRSAAPDDNRDLRRPEQPAHAHRSVGCNHNPDLRRSWKSGNGQPPSDRHCPDFDVTYQHSDTSHPGDVTALVDPLGQIWSRAYDAEETRSASRSGRRQVDRQLQRDRLVNQRRNG